MVAPLLATKGNFGPVLTEKLPPCRSLVRPLELLPLYKPIEKTLELLPPCWQLKGTLECWSVIKAPGYRLPCHGTLLSPPMEKRMS